MKNRFFLKYFVFIALFLFALILRLRGLSSISFWFDELWTATHWTHPASFVDVWNKLWLPVEGNLPLYPFFINLWSSIFGTSELSLIAPSIIFGSATVSLLFFYAEKKYGFWSGLFAAGLMATLSNPLYFSLEARGYSLIMFLVSFNLLTKSKKLPWSISALLICWTHYFGILFILTQFIFDIRTRKKNLNWYVLPFSGISILLPLIFFQIQNGPKFLKTNHFPEFWNWTFDSDFQYLTLLLVIMLVIQTLIMFLPFVKKSNEDYELLLYVYTPFIFLWVWNILISPVNVKRYFITIIPTAILSISSLFNRIEVKKSRMAIGIFSLLIGVSFVSSLRIDIRKYHKFPHLKEALVIINQDETKTLFVKEADFKLWNYYLKEFENIQVMMSTIDEPIFWYIDLKYEKNSHPSDMPGFRILQIKDIGLTRMFKLSK